MIKILINIIFLIFFTNVKASEFKLEEIFKGLKNPWSLSFVSNDNIILTEKSGKLFSLDLNKKEIVEIKHNLSIKEHGQGGLLDVIYKNNQVYVSYSEKLDQWETSTSVAKGKFSKSNIKFKNIFRSEPPINSGFHLPTRLLILEP